MHVLGQNPKHNKRSKKLLPTQKKNTSIQRNLNEEKTNHQSPFDNEINPQLIQQRIAQSENRFMRERDLSYSKFKNTTVKFIGIHNIEETF